MVSKCLGVFATLHDNELVLHDHERCASKCGSGLDTVLRQHKTDVVGPEMPAFFTSTSSPPSAFTAAGYSRSMSGRFDMSPEQVCTQGISRAGACGSRIASQSQAAIGVWKRPRQCGCQA